MTVPYSGSSGQTNSTVQATTYTYDALNRQTQITDAAGGTETFTYTQNDVYIALGPAPTGENQKRRQLEYDGLGRVTSVCEINGGTTAWPSGTCSQSSAQTGYWTKYTFNVLDKITAVTQNAQSSTTQTRSYAFDGLARMTSETNGESGTTTYSYDSLTSDAACGTYSSAGDMVKKVDAVGTTTCYQYDALHRITSVKYSGGYASSTQNKTFVYDGTTTVNGATMTNAKGRLSEAYTYNSSAPSTKVTDLGFGYSVLGDLTDAYESTTHSGGYYHVSSGYWPASVLASISGLPGLPTMSFGPDSMGQIASVSASSGQNPVLTVDFGYGQGFFPNVIGVQYGTQDWDSFTFDGAFRMTKYQFSVGSSALVGTLTLNTNSSLQQLQITDPFNSADAQTCTYSADDLARIASVNCGSVWSQTFSYDAFGNITKSGSRQFQPTYSAATNRITTLSGATPAYDADGNLTTYDSTHTYSWDGDGNAITVEGVGVTYDAMDRAVEQNNSGSYTQIVYAPSGFKLGLMSGQTLSKAFVPLPGGATAVYNSSGLAYYRHPDWLGSSRLASTPSKTIYSDTAYAPFGETYAQSGTTDASFTGQNADTVSDLYDFPARPNHPVEGRWLRPDTSGARSAKPRDPQSWNRYAYLMNRPLTLVDPLGLDCVYLNDGGTGVEWVDQNSYSGECADNGGYWVEGTAQTVVIDPNSDYVGLQGVENYGNMQIQSFAGYIGAPTEENSETSAVFIGSYINGIDNPFGHLAIDVLGWTTDPNGQGGLYGLDPAGGASADVLTGQTVPGAVEPESTSAFSTGSALLYVNGGIAQNLTDKIVTDMVMPPNYNMLSQNCSTWVSNVLATVNINSPHTLTPMGFTWTAYNGFSINSTPQQITIQVPGPH